jgi:hypothetical protein
MAVIETVNNNEPIKEVMGLIIVNSILFPIIILIVIYIHLYNTNRTIYFDDEKVIFVNAFSKKREIQIIELTYIYGNEHVPSRIGLNEKTILIYEKKNYKRIVFNGPIETLRKPRIAKESLLLLDEFLSKIDHHSTT